METECFTPGIYDQHAVADAEVAQAPKYRRVSTRAIQVPSYHGAAPFARMGTRIVPADIIPGILSRRFHRAVWSNAYRLDRGIDTDSRNKQACKWCWRRICCDRSER